MGQQDRNTGGRPGRRARGRSKGARRLAQDGLASRQGDLYIVPEPGGSLPGGTPDVDHVVELPDAPPPRNRHAHGSPASRADAPADMVPAGRQDGAVRLGLLDYPDAGTDEATRAVEDASPYATPDVSPYAVPRAGRGRRKPQAPVGQTQVISFGDRPKASRPAKRPASSSDVRPVPRSAPRPAAAPKSSRPAPRPDAHPAPRPAASQQPDAAVSPSHDPAEEQTTAPAKSPAPRRAPFRKPSAAPAAKAGAGQQANAGAPGRRPLRRKVARSGASEAQQTARMNLKMREEDIRRRRREPLTREQRAVVAASALVMVLLVGLVVYPPAQGLYSAVRLKEYHEQQLAVAQENNRAMEERVRALQTQEGIQDEARSRYGLVMPGETLGMVVGAPSSTADQDSSSAGQDSGGWVTRLLDGVFDVSEPTDGNTAPADAELVAKAVPNATVATADDQAQSAQDAPGAADVAASDGSADEAADSAAADGGQGAADVVVNQDADVVVDAGSGA